ncbi:hypothetical protein ACF0H5_007796 [Mactra antiquata]
MVDDEKYSLKIEATEVIKEIKYAVKSVELSQTLKCNDELVFFNLETKENKRYCVELTPRGFRLIGNNFDVMDNDTDNSKYYETIYSLLDSISLQYRNTFGDALAQKLQGLQDLQQTADVEET